MSKTSIGNIKGPKGDKGDAGDASPEMIAAAEARAESVATALIPTRVEEALTAAGIPAQVAAQVAAQVTPAVFDAGRQAALDAIADDPTVVAEAAELAQSTAGLVHGIDRFPVAAAGGMIGENGRAIDLTVDEDGNFLDGTVDRLAPRLEQRGLIAGAGASQWNRAGIVSEEGREIDLTTDDQGNLLDSTLDRLTPRLVPRLVAAGIGGDIEAGVLRQVYAGPDIITVGDSLTGDGRIAAKLAELTGRTSRNMAVGGETVPTILARMGVWPFLMAPVGGALPASGSVDVTFQSSYHTPGTNIWPLLQGTGVREGDTYLWGTLAGVRVRLSMRVKDSTVPYPLHGDGDVYQLTRATPGDAITLPRPVPFIPEYGMARAGDIIIAGIGQNGPGDDADYAGFEAIAQWARKAGKRFLFWSKTAGIANTGWTPLEKRLADRWGRRYCNIRRFLIDDAMPIMGLIPTVQDNADIAAGRVPEQLRKPNDATHHTHAAQDTFTEHVFYARLKELGDL